jgi:hypothetical protein
MKYISLSLTIDTPDRIEQGDGALKSTLLIADALIP